MKNGLFYLICILTASCQDYNRVPAIYLDSVSVTDSSISSANCTFRIIDLGNNEIEQFGVCYDTSLLFRSPIYQSYDSFPDTKAYSALLHGLHYNTSYFVKGFVQTTHGAYFYSPNYINISTANVQTPSYTFFSDFKKLSFSDTWVKLSIDTSSFNASNDPKTIFGICYSCQTWQPNITNDTICIDKHNATVTIANLQPNTLYTFRGFAKNRGMLNYCSTVDIRTSAFISGIEMVWLKGADSTDGSFYISRYEVTQEVWQAVTNLTLPKSKGTLPETGHSLNEIETSFVAKINAMTATTAQFELPTEAQWRFAAKGSNGADSYIYSGSNKIDEVAYHVNYKTSKDVKQVGGLKQNSAGIYDMSGNARELCCTNYSLGGSIFDDSTKCRISSDPIKQNDNSTLTYLGFRLMYK